MGIVTTGWEVYNRDQVQSYVRVVDSTPLKMSSSARLVAPWLNSCLARVRLEVPQPSKFVIVFINNAHYLTNCYSFIASGHLKRIFMAYMKAVFLTQNNKNVTKVVVLSFEFEDKKWHPTPLVDRILHELLVLHLVWPIAQTCFITQLSQNNFLPAFLSFSSLILRSFLSNSVSSLAWVCPVVIQ